MNNWLDRIAHEIKLKPTHRRQREQFVRMFRALKELAGYTSDFAIEMGGYHIFLDTYPEASDDAKELIEQLISIPTRGYWYGKPIEEYTKEELIDIVSQLGTEVDAIHTRHIKDLEFLSALHSM